MSAVGSSVDVHGPRPAGACPPVRPAGSRQPRPPSARRRLRRPRALAGSMSPAVGLHDLDSYGRRPPSFAASSVTPAPRRRAARPARRPCAPTSGSRSSARRRSARASRPRDEHRRPGRGSRRRAAAPRGTAAMAGGSLMRPIPHSPSASSPSSGPTSATPRARSGRDVGLRGRRAPTCARSWRARGSTGAAVEGERALRDDVIGQAGRELGQRVGRARRDHEQVGLDRGAGKSSRGASRRASASKVFAETKLSASGVRMRRHLVTRPDEQARELAGLVGRDSAGHAEKDPSHGHIVPAAAKTANPAGPYVSASTKGAA